MTIETLPFERRPRNSIANNLDKINELVDWANLGTHLYASATGESVTVDVASSVKGLKVDGRSVQDGTPTPDAPVPVQVVDEPLSLVIGDASVAIDLQGNTLASLPAGATVLTDGARDVLRIDSAGHTTADMETGIVVFDGSEDEGWGISSTFSNQPYTTLISNYILRPPTTGRMVPMLCNRLISVTAASITTGSVGIGVTATGTIVVRMGSSDADLTAFKADLAANPLVIIYPLATPQTIDLGYIAQPAIPSGSVVTVSASLTPTFDLEWWVDDGITALVDDLIAYIDYKTEG